MYKLIVEEYKFNWIISYIQIQVKLINLYD